MTEHGASIFVFFFLGEYSSLILMSAFMSVFFLGGHHCPDLHMLLLDPLFSLYIYLKEGFFNITQDFLIKEESSYYYIYNWINTSIKNMIGIYPADFNQLKTVTQFSSKDTIYSSINIFIDKLQGSYIFGFKIILIVFMFIWVRASFPRYRYDQLMSLCWKELLPLVFAYIIFALCLFYALDMMPFGTHF